VLVACASANAVNAAQPATSATAAAPGAASTAATTQARAITPDQVSAAIAAARAAADAGNRERALAILDAALGENPRDARLRFAKAVQLAEAGRQALALTAFTELTQEFPELPEPHNNLATIYASRGELDLALNQLEMALRALPSYALAQENLGDLYLRLAERSYQLALQARPESESVRAKLTLAREMIKKIITVAP
jgi:tetratricopeptide (TPR) repeat protein